MKRNRILAISGALAVLGAAVPISAALTPCVECDATSASPIHNPLSDSVHRAEISPLLPDGGVEKSRAAGIAGEGIDAVRMAVTQSEVDFSVPVKHGLSLAVERHYSSLGFEPAVSDEAGALGPGWRLAVEAQLYLGYGSSYVFADERGVRRTFEPTSDPNVFESKLEHGEPCTLEVVSGTPVTYAVTTADRRVLTFDEDGRLTSIEADGMTPTQENLTIEYEALSLDPTQSRIKRIVSPSGDGRSLEFNYDSNPLTVDDERRVERIDFNDGASATPVMFYSYDVAGRLAEVRWNSGTADHAVFYEYGSASFSQTTVPNDTISLSTASTDALGATGTLSGGQKKYRTAYSYPTKAPETIQQWNYDPSAGAWDEAVTVKRTTDSKRDILFGEGGSAAPGAELSVDPTYGTINAVVYDNTTADIPSLGYAPAGASSWGPGVSRLVGSVYSEGGTEPIRERLYDLSASDHLDKTRLIQLIHRIDSDANTSPTTQIEYSPDYPARVEAIYRLPDPGAAVREQVRRNTYYGTSDGAHRAGRLQSVEFGTGRLITFDYDSEGQVVEVTTPEGIYTLTRNTRGEVVSVSQPDGDIVSFTYNAYGLVKTKSRLNLGTTRYYYSTDSAIYGGSPPMPGGEPLPAAESHTPPRLVQSVDPLGGVKRYFYDSSGRLAERVDARGHSLYYSYDDRHRLVSIVNDLGEEVEYDYDLNDRRIAFKDGRDNETSYTLDEFGRLLGVTDPAGEAIGYLYAKTLNGSGDGAGRQNLVRSRILQDGQAVSYKYDQMSRLVSVDYDATPGVELAYSYDYASRLVEAADQRLTLAGDKTYSYEYTISDLDGDGVHDLPSGLLSKMVHPEGVYEEFFYDSSGVLEAYRDVDGGLSRFTHDAGRLDTLTDPYGGVTEWTYAAPADSGYPVGAPKERTLANGAVEAYGYEALSGRLDTIVQKDGAGAIFDWVDLEYDPAALVSSRERSNGAGGVFRVDYTYDASGRLIAETGPRFARTYSYDAAGNRASMAIGGVGNPKTTTYTYGPRNEMAAHTGYWTEGILDTGSETLIYDDRGNLTELRDDADPVKDRWIYSWNAENRMTAADKLVNGQAVTSLRYHYDFRNRRILAEDDDGARERFFFRGQTETIRKVSVPGAHTDDAFQIEEAYDASGGALSNLDVVADQDRLSDVFEKSGYWDNVNEGGRMVWDSGDGIDVQGMKTFSVWLKTVNEQGADFTLHLETDSGRRQVSYLANGASNSTSDVYPLPPAGPDGLNDTASVGLDGKLGDYDEGGEWVRLERNIQSDIDSLFPGETLVRVTGVSTWADPAMGNELRWDDLRFSNSVTSRHVVSEPGELLGHVLRERSIDLAASSSEDRFYHYDQVGSVIAVTNESGALDTRRYSDAFGNDLQSTMTGLWGPLAERGQNSTSVDGATDLGYMRYRWYMPKLGIFASAAPRRPHHEHQYNFAVQNPLTHADPLGEFPLVIGDDGERIPITAWLPNFRTITAPELELGRWKDAGKEDTLSGFDDLELGIDDLPGDSGGEAPDTQDPDPEPEPEPEPGPEGGKGSVGESLASPVSPEPRSSTN